MKTQFIWANVLPLICPTHWGYQGTESTFTPETNRNPWADSDASISDKANNRSWGTYFIMYMTLCVKKWALSTLDIQRMPFFVKTA